MKTLRLTISIALCLLFLPYTASSLAADFSFKDINGKRHNLSDYRGKWVLVNYWATFCGPCKMEVSHLNKIKRSYNNEVAIIGLEAGSSSDAKVREFMQNNGMRFTVAPTQLSIAKQPLGPVPKLPTTFIVDPQGKVVKAHTGILTENQIKPYLTSAKASPAPAPQAAPQAQAEPAPAPQQAAPEPVAKPEATTPKTAPKAETQPQDNDFLMGIDLNAL
ncbi:MAG: TlpA disulfide reductase family protein [bacterium]